MTARAKVPVRCLCWRSPRPPPPNPMPCLVCRPRSLGGRVGGRECSNYRTLARVINFEARGSGAAAAWHSLRKFRNKPHPPSVHLRARRGAPNFIRVLALLCFAAFNGPPFPPRSYRPARCMPRQRPTQSGSCGRGNSTVLAGQVILTAVIVLQ